MISLIHDWTAPVNVHSFTDSAIGIEANYTAGVFSGRRKFLRGLQSQMLHQVAALGYHLIVVDPHVAVAGEHVHVRFGFPVGVCLAAVGIAESDVHAGKFFVLQQHADHLG